MEGGRKSYGSKYHLPAENLDTWVERRGIRPLLATNLDLYRPGHMPVSTGTEPPTSSTQQLLQPRTQPLTVKMRDAGSQLLGGHQQSASGRFTSTSSTPSVDLKRKWGATEGLADHSQLSWLIRPSDQQADMVSKLTPVLPMAPKLNNPGGNGSSASAAAQSTKAQHHLTWLFQEISQAEIPSKEWINSRRDQTTTTTTTGFNMHHDRNALASPPEHNAMSEDHTSSVELRQAGSTTSDVNLTRTGSISSEDFVDLDSSWGGRRSSLPRNNSINTVSKNLVSERRRRKKLNDGLYSLRALVPKISKMDKASIVGDAIEHVKELQQQIETIELEIAEMESKCCANNSVDGDSGGSNLSESGDHGGAVAAVPVSGIICEVVEAAAVKPVTGEISPATDHLNTVTVASTAYVTLADSQGQSPVVDQNKILKMDVAKLEEQMYQLQISCQRVPGVLVQLTQALESLDLDVLNAYHTAFQESMLNTFIVEMRNLDCGEVEDVRSSLLDAVALHGLAH